MKKEILTIIEVDQKNFDRKLTKMVNEEWKIINTNFFVSNGLYFWAVLEKTEPLNDVAKSPYFLKD